MTDNARGFTPIQSDQDRKVLIEHMVQMDLVHMQFKNMNDHRWADQSGMLTVYVMLTYTGKQDDGYLVGRMAQSPSDLFSAVESRVERMPLDLIQAIMQEYGDRKDRTRPLGAIEAAVVLLRDSRLPASQRTTAAPRPQATNPSTQSQPRPSPASRDTGIPQQKPPPRGVEIAGATHHSPLFEQG